MDYKLILYRIGLAMIAYDMLGHGLCLLARITGNTGAKLWNNYSKYLFPIIANCVMYDLRWTLWFLVALMFIIQYKGM